MDTLSSSSTTMDGEHQEREEEEDYYDHDDNHVDVDDDDDDDDDEQQQQQEQRIILNPIPLFTNFLSLQYSIFLALSSPIFSLLSLASESFRRAEEAKDEVDSAVHSAASAVPRGGTAVLRMVAYGILAAVYVGLILTITLFVAIIIGVSLVHLWVDEPVFLREKVDFDYSIEHPAAVFEFGEGQKFSGVPVGHTFYVTLELLMPESDFNRHIGMFQVTAEVVSIKGNVMARSSQPCMLRYRSFPIRLVRTFLMGIPLLLGITSETQKLVVPMLKHREGYLRTESIKIKILPRAKMTSFLPELYQAEILLKSELPWSKEVVHRWKWTFYVWTSLYVYVVILITIFYWFRPLLFPRNTRRSQVEEHPPDRSVEGSESLRKWQQSRSKRKATVTGLGTDPGVGSSASTTTLTRDDDVSVADSESVSYRG